MEGTSTINMTFSTRSEGGHGRNLDPHVELEVTKCTSVKKKLPSFLFLFIINFTNLLHVGGSRAWSGYGQHDGRTRTSETEGGKSPGHGERAGWGIGEYS